MKKIIIIAPKIPSKFGKGYQVLSYQRLKALELNYNIEIYFTKVSFFKNKEIFKSFKLQHKTQKFHISIFEFIFNIIKCLIFKQPLQTAFCTSKDLSSYLNNKEFDFIIFYMSRCWMNLSNIACEKIGVEFVDSMALNFQRRAKIKNPLKKWFYNREAQCCLNFEKSIMTKVLFGTTVSKIDANYISTKINVLPLGVDLPKFSNEKSKFICFTGNMNYQPNLEAFNWFYENVWKPNYDLLAPYKMKVIGSSPPKRLIQLSDKDKSIIVTGYVDDISEEISKCIASVAPMQSGSGMQFKILEAMAVSVPVIATTLAVGDIKATNNHNIIISNEPNDFIKSLSELIRCRSNVKDIGKRGRDFVIKNHSWENINKSFINLLTIN